MAVLYQVVVVIVVVYLASKGRVCKYIAK